ncbi:MAG: PilN domain-containing protein [Lautropia sp.]|nr:PilN domain-containing protein [Lautropia sp.]
MIRINLLPHREQKRERRKRDFTGQLIIAALAGGALVFLGGMFINHQIENQKARNDLISAENQKLDTQIAEIKDLESAIASLKARQKSVEDLQSDRTIPVHLFDELVKLTPEGVYLTKLDQHDRNVMLSGMAQSNERVAEFLRNLSEHSPWLEKPQLEEIREAEARSRGKDGDVSRVHEFRLNVLVKRPDPAANTPAGQVALNNQAGVK